MEVGETEIERMPAGRADGSPGAPPGVRSRRFLFDGDEHLVLCFALVLGCGTALTRAELAIAEAILAGASNRDIARERERSVKTVANQVAALFRKLGVRSRQELAFALAQWPTDGAGNGCARDVDSRLRWFARAILRSGSHSDGNDDLTALAAGQWRVVHHFDADAHRYVVARRAPEPLSADEQVIVRRRARGDSVKEIAIDLGVSSATVSRRLSSALCKLGLVSHAALPRLFAAARAA